ncbi:protein of unknown function DUF1326 [Methylocella silvestris BL2]|uniref:DUF1326 domain-containing protein n=1 Tax=Methylocella silvestris (strain DSM 15510 / CIP 108128 / LMG 27833 / NCIMB 13906 / BL2) TaxID=395965 RepID=B8EQ92_METSB|nr:DUF1326 domain-containing protein [Methylocella silvestris]ACK51582.1 protein of unknown function DUF1326 [Methylocella silvestris BL2]
MTQWKLTGAYFETCNCEAACPCVFGSAPTEGFCTAIVAWHIKHGVFDDVALDGLNVALLVDAAGNMAENKWKVAAYIDEKASETQRNALATIFSGQAGGHPAVLASFFGEHLGTKSVAMDYQGNGKNRSLRIPGIADAEIEALEGQDGKAITIENHPLCIAPGEPATVARSKHFRLADYGYDWKLSGRNGYLSNFSYSGA